MHDPEDRDGVDEFGHVFLHAPSIETYEAIYRQVLLAYEHRCALTGEQFAPASSGLHPFLEVVAIRPRELGGPLHVANFLPFCQAGAKAFAAGHFVIADDFTIIADRTVIDPALATRIGQSLSIPADPLYRPDRAHLAYRRRTVLG